MEFCNDRGVVSLKTIYVCESESLQKAESESESLQEYKSESESLQNVLCHLPSCRAGGVCPLGEVGD